MTSRDIWLYFTRPYLLAAAAIVLVSLPTAIKKIRLGLRKEKFVCLMCGNCCRFGIIELSEDDVKRIGSHGYGGFHERENDEIRLRKANGKCVFLEDGKCSIHDFKPEVCRRFPFFTFLGVSYARGLHTCPGLKKLGMDFRGK